LMIPLIKQVTSEGDNAARAIKELSAAVSVSRSSYYRHRRTKLRPRAVPATEKRRRATIETIALEMPNYGHRPMTAELQRRRLPTGRDRVLRYMREANLLCRRRRAFISTTNSNHGLPVFPNLTKDLKVTDINQLWVADITYIQLPQRFVYLAVLLDAFSRRVIGWALERHMMTELPLAALQMALDTRDVRRDDSGRRLRCRPRRDLGPRSLDADRRSARGPRGRQPQVRIAWHASLREVGADPDASEGRRARR